MSLSKSILGVAAFVFVSAAAEAAPDGAPNHRV